MEIEDMCSAIGGNSPLDLCSYCTTRRWAAQVGESANERGIQKNNVSFGNDVADDGAFGGVVYDDGLAGVTDAFEDGLLGWLQHSVKSAQDTHGEDNVGVFAAFEEVTQNVIGDTPDEGNDFVVNGLIHLVYAFFDVIR